MIVEIISIIFSSLLALIAIIVSVVSINRQTKSQNINASIQLFDKRFEIYLFVIDLWYIIGYFEGGLSLKPNRKYHYSEIIYFINSVKLPDDIVNRINYAYKNSNRYYQMQDCLFSGEVSEYLDKLLSAFTTYINGIYHKKSVDKKKEESAYHQIINFLETEILDMEELRKYINLSDIKRIDL